MSKSKFIIRAMKAGEEDTLVKILVQGFKDDPVSCLIDPDLPKRLESLNGLFSSFVGSKSEEVRVDTTENLDGVAIWKRTIENVIEEQPQGMNAAAKELFSWVDHNAPPTPYWYLAFISAKEKGSGVGTALIKSRLNEFKQAANPADRKVALWTGNGKNVGFYEHLGFKLFAERKLEGSPGAWWLVSE